MSSNQRRDRLLDHTLRKTDCIHFEKQQTMDQVGRLAEMYRWEELDSKIKLDRWGEMSVLRRA